MKQLNKILSLLLVLVMVIGMLPMNVFATNSYDQDYTGNMGTDVSYIGGGTEGYKITVPATLAPGASGTVTVEGTWASNRVLNVIAEETVTLTNSIDSSLTKELTVTFAGISKSGSNTVAIKTTDDGAFTTVFVSEITNALFGTWSGTFYYNVEMESIEQEITSYRFGDAIDQGDYRYVYTGCESFEEFKPGLLRGMFNASGDTTIISTEAELFEMFAQMYGFSTWAEVEALGLTKEMIYDEFLGDINKNEMYQTYLDSGMNMPGWSVTDVFDNRKEYYETIPEKVENIPVTSLSGTFCGCSSLLAAPQMPNSIKTIGYDTFEECYKMASITIPDSVRKIGQAVFDRCYALTEINLPDSVDVIGAAAFINCTGLTSIYIPSNVREIGDSAFSNCRALVEIIVDDNNQKYCDIDGVLFNKSLTELVRYPQGKANSSYHVIDSVTVIRYNSFESCGKLKTITFGENSQLTNIEEYAFENCGLTAIEIPDRVTDIGERAFRDCSSLTSVTFGDNSKLTTIGDDAFMSTKLTTLSIPNSVTTIWGIPFTFCNNFQYNQYDNAYYVGNGENPYLFLVNAINSDITSCVTHEDMRGICGEAFSGCKNLSSFTIPDGVTYIGVSTFSGCNSLTEITIPDSVTIIYNGAFSQCINLKNVNMSKNVTSIGQNVFYNCTSLISITIPATVNFIGYSAFANCELVAAIFETPNGWQCEWRHISADDLMDTATAAMYLQSTYSDGHWYRTVGE